MLQQRHHCIIFNNLSTRNTQNPNTQNPIKSRSPPFHIFQIKYSLSSSLSSIYLKKKFITHHFNFPNAPLFNQPGKQKRHSHPFIDFTLPQYLKLIKRRSIFHRDWPLYLSFSLSLSRLIYTHTHAHTHTQHTGSLRHHRSSFRVELSRVNFLLSCTCMTDTTIHGPIRASSMKHFRGKVGGFVYF